MLRRTRLFWMMACCALAVSAARSQVDERRGTTAELGKHYTLGVAHKFDVVFKRAEYTLDRAIIADGYELLAKADKRVLLHFSVQNAMPSEEWFSSDAVPMTVVDAEKANHEVRGFWWIEGKTDSGAMELKPAQRIEVCTFVDIPVEAEPAKLLVLPGGEDEAPILRYPLTGKIKAYAAAVADPADKTGARPLDEIPAAKGQWAQVGVLDAQLVELANYDGKVPDEELEEGKHWMVATLGLRNLTNQAVDVYTDVVCAKLLLEDETDIGQTTQLMAKAAKAVQIQLKPKAETTVRAIFAVGADDKPVKLMLFEGQENCRPVVIALATK